MNEADVIALPLPDARARRRIQTELDVNLLVEAGAGSGKTTELVGRMAALVASDIATVDQIAAVTFTRKAAGELRERFQARLEADLRRADQDEHVAGLLRRALDELDRAFIGTIHAFCARLLRERPLEVGLDPGFQELPVDERDRFYRSFWESYLERLARDSDPVLEELSEAGLRTGQLYGLFQNVVENPDVRFPVDEVSPPSAARTGPIRRALEDIVERGRELMPAREPERGWDSFQRKLRTAAFTLDVTGWERPADFFEALALLCRHGTSPHKTTYNRWREKALAKDLERRANEFGFGDTPARALLDQWYAHRYALSLRLAQRAADAFAEHRRRSGRLDFQDLLLLTARLLRTDPDARAELGRRYRRLLVDEFQDTDPLQAEIMLLLASDPEESEAPEIPASDGPPSDGAENGGDEARPADWRTAVPRPGALFVVGDPKQSIYRFRRADIQLYEFVKRRFRDFGSVVELTSNFRSRPAIGDLVNQVFDDPAFFPSEASAEQARFEPLNTRPSDLPVPGEGVFWYAVESDRDAYAAVAEDDAGRLAAWIRQRLDAGGRRPEDFLVLTRYTRSLSIYARALEAHGIPVQVTGAGVGVEHELQELLVLLECMTDPTDPVKVVAVLVGLFFGLDHERLLAHRMAGGTFDVIRRGKGGDPDVREALSTLHGWWRSASRDPSDVFVGRVASELGLLPFAAAGDLGSIRAGALVFALDAVRSAALGGDTSLPGALEALRAALEAREAEAPLEPGRPDVARLMNLHQAKGLEASVVILADPTGMRPRSPSMHVERGPDGSGSGYLCVADAGIRASTPVARPPSWDEKERAEVRFEAAEQVRLLYVAATRAREELVVARRAAKPDGSPWSPLDPWLLENAAELVLEHGETAPPETLVLPPDEVARRVEEAARRLEALSEPSYRHVSVTQVAKGDGEVEGAAPAEGATAGEGDASVSASREGSAAPPREGFRGYSWGSAVHGALAAAALDDSEVYLRGACRALLMEHGRPLDDHGEPRELEELMALVRSVRASDLWIRAASSGRILAEIPFAVTGATRPPRTPPSDAGSRDDPRDRRKARRQLDLFVGETDAEPFEDDAPPPSPDEPGAVPSVLEGVIDLAFREKGGWVIADYKTDVGTDPDFPKRVDAYRRQVELYAEAWARLTGEPVKERVLFFTAQNRVEAW